MNAHELELQFVGVIVLERRKNVNEYWTDSPKLSNFSVHLTEDPLIYRSNALFPCGAKKFEGGIGSSTVSAVVITFYPCSESRIAYIFVYVQQRTY